MNRILRIAAVVFAVLLVGASILLVPTLWGKPWSIDHFFLRSLIYAVMDHPMILSSVRPLDAYDLDFYSDDLEDYSTEGDTAIYDHVDEVLLGLRAYDRASLTEDQQLSYDVLEWVLVTQQAGRAFRYHSYPLNQFNGAQSELPDFMINIHQINDERDARNYLARIEKFENALEGMRGAVLDRAERGFLPPRFVLEAVQREAADFASTPSVEGVLYTKFSAALEDLEDIPLATKDSLRSELRRLIESVVQPGYLRLAETLGELAGQANDDHGVWKHANGEAYYRWALRWHTTTDRTPDEIHQIGLAEIKRIHGEMSRILVEEGLSGDDPIATLLELNRDPRFLYPDSNEGRDEILKDYREIIADVDGRLPELFGRLPMASVEVKRVPVFKEAGAAGAYYNPPSLDGSRPGVFYANLRDVSEVQRFRMRTLAFHEAVPGHHLQIALSMETEGLPFFRRFLPMTAFMEGWALYAERLAMEEGYHDTSYDELGALSAELFRAVRLVVDTGLHAKRWTREQAIEFMIEKSGMPRGDVTAEIERYIVSPGQACSYKMGQLKILELRERAKSKLRAAFDLRAFNDVVLSGGALPLAVLDEVVSRWIADGGAQ